MVRPWLIEEPAGGGYIALVFDGFALAFPCFIFCSVVTLRTKRAQHNWARVLAPWVIVYIIGHVDVAGFNLMVVGLPLAQLRPSALRAFHPLLCHMTFWSYGIRP